jgi:hypothetical protein
MNRLLEWARSSKLRELTAAVHFRNDTGEMLLRRFQFRTDEDVEKGSPDYRHFVLELNNGPVAAEAA